MRIGESVTLGKDGVPYFKLRDIAGRVVTVLKEKRGNSGPYGPYTVWAVDNSELKLRATVDGRGEIVPKYAAVIVPEGNVPDQIVREHFEKHPEEPVELVVYKTISATKGKQYWMVADPLEYESRFRLKDT